MPKHIEIHPDLIDVIRNTFRDRKKNVQIIRFIGLKQINFVRFIFTFHFFIVPFSEIFIERKNYSKKKCAKRNSTVEKYKIVHIRSNKFEDNTDNNS